MSKIKKVFYDMIPSQEMSIDEVSDYYFLSNMAGFDPTISEQLADHEFKTVKFRNRIIGTAIHNGDCPKSIRLDSAIFGISPLHGGVMTMAELN